MRHAAVVSVLLVATSLATSAFVPSRSTSRSTGPFTPGQHQSSIIADSGSTSRLLVSSRGNSNNDGDSIMDMDDDALRFAYKEWKLIYGKEGEAFNDTYFQNFKVNYRALMAANLKARREAEQRGQPAPRWMSLNEYGDFSMEEYETLQREGGPRARGGRATTTASSYSQIGVNGVIEERQDQFGRPIRSTQVLQQQQEQRGTQVVMKQEAQQQQQTRGTQVISQSPQSSEYQDQFGRTVRPTQPLQSGFQTTDEFAKYDNRGTRVIQSGVGGSAGGTQVIRQGPTDSLSSPPALDNRSTLVIKNNDDGRATVVLTRSNDADNDDQSGMGGTQVIQSASAASSDPSTRSYGTQVISMSSGPNGSSNSNNPARVAPYGTTAIQSASPGTQVINTTSNSKSQQSPITATSGTLVIPKNANIGATTQINPPAGGTKSGNKGTMVIPKGDTESWSQQFLNSLPMFGSDDEYGNSRYNDDNEDEDKIVVGRGTMVIKRQIPEPRPSMNLFSLLMGPDKKIEESDVPRGTLNMKGEPVKFSPLVETPPPSSNTTGKSLFDFFSSSTQKVDSSIRTDGTTKIAGKQPPTQSNTDDEISVEPERKPDIFSFFGGKQKSDSSRSVRGTIIIQKDGKNVLRAAEGIGRKTVLIPKKESEVGPPSILSFFGGAKKVKDEEVARNPSARSTLIIKKPAKTKPLFWSPFSAVDTAPAPTENLVSPAKKQNMQLKTNLPKPNAMLQPKMTDVSAKVCVESMFFLLISKPGRSFSFHLSPPKTTKNKNDSEMAKQKARINAQIAEQREKTEAAARKKIEVAKEKELRRLELQQQRLEATRKRQELAERKKRGEPDSSRKTPVVRLQTSSQPKKPQLSFFGADIAVPEVKKWKQNPDGSVTGFIYKSRNFKDGTRVTTSPVPPGARRGTVVTTTAGTQYYLE
jgi:hypothetical protein